MNQIAFDWSAPQRPPSPPHNRSRGDSLEDRFWAYHAENPQVYQALRRLALNLKRRGVQRYGIGGLFEVLRWQTAMQTTGDEFKLNNNYRSFYARLIMERTPELDGFFETRQQTWQEHDL